jgi:hypothetical protein
MKTEKFYTVVAPSAIHHHRLCLLGSGTTRKAAIEDAYGPGGKLGGKLSSRHFIKDFESRDAAQAELGDGVMP